MTVFPARKNCKVLIVFSNGKFFYVFSFFFCCSKPKRNRKRNSFPIHWWRRYIRWRKRKKFLQWTMSKRRNIWPMICRKNFCRYLDCFVLAVILYCSGGAKANFSFLRFIVGFSLGVRFFRPPGWGDPMNSSLSIRLLVLTSLTRFSWNFRLLSKHCCLQPFLPKDSVSLLFA